MKLWTNADIKTELSETGSDGKAFAYDVRDLGSISGLGRFPGEGNGNPLQYSCMENPMDGGTWSAIVHGVAKSRTWLSDFTFTFTGKNPHDTDVFILKEKWQIYQN